MIEFELKLNALRNIPSKYERITIKELVKLTGINWHEALQIIYKKKQLKNLDFIVINNKNYAIQLASLLQITTQRTIGKINC